MEYALSLPVWGSLTGAHPGLLTSENKKAFGSYWYPLLESMKRKEIENRCHLWRILIYYLLAKPFIMCSFILVKVSKDLYLPYIDNFDLLTLFIYMKVFANTSKQNKNMNWIVTLHLQAVIKCKKINDNSICIYVRRSYSYFRRILSGLHLRFVIH